jgi:hypothetical protein
MKSTLSSNTLVMRHSLKVHEALTPDLYQALVGLPKDIRGEFIMQVLRDWSRGILTPMPDGWSIDAASAPASPKAPTNDLAVGRRPTKNLTTVQGQSVTRQMATQTGTNEAPKTGGLEALGFRSMEDVGDAFDYTTPRS